MPPSALGVAVVCMINMNRSMQAHSILQKKGFSVCSFGARSPVRLPGPTRCRPHPMRCDFSTRYVHMCDDLSRKDLECYCGNGILRILERKERIKPHPERFQECSDSFEVIFTCEERVYDQVVQELCAREQVTFRAVHVVDMDIEDTLEEATFRAFLICELCQSFQQADDMEDSGSAAVGSRGENRKEHSSHGLLLLTVMAGFGPLLIKNLCVGFRIRLYFL